MKKLLFLLGVVSEDTFSYTVGGQTYNYTVSLQTFLGGTGNPVSELKLTYN